MKVFSSIAAVVVILMVLAVLAALTYRVVTYFLGLPA